MANPEKLHYTYIFKHDLKNILKVENYLEENYEEDRDYVKTIEKDDVMNALSLISDECRNDDQLFDLIHECDLLHVV